MRSPTRVAALLAVAVVATTAGTALGSSTRSAGQLTVVPPAYYAGTSRSESLTGSNRLYGGPGRDLILGEPGNDRLYARDGVQDTLNGGPGFDEAWVDALDVVRNVERVHRG